MKAESGFGILFAFILFLFIFAFCIYFLNMFFKFMPIPPGAANTIYNPERGILSTTTAIFDNSFVFFFAIAVIVMIAGAYIHPSKGAGFADIILLFVLVFLVLYLHLLIMPINQVLHASTLIPIAYDFLSGNYLIGVLFFGSIGAIVLNFRDPNKVKKVAANEVSA